MLSGIRNIRASSKIEVSTNGEDISVWKPDVDKIKAFIEDLVDEPCVIIPMTKKEQLAQQSSLEEALRASLKK